MSDMVNDELVKSENRDFSFRHDHFTGIRHNYELFFGHDYNFAFEQLLDTNLQIGASCEDNDVWNRLEEHKEMNLQDSRTHNDGTREGAGLDGNQNDFHLSFPDNDDSETSEIDKLTVIGATGGIHKQESQEIDDNLEFLKYELHISLVHMNKLLST